MFVCNDLAVLFAEHMLCDSYGTFLPPFRMGSSGRLSIEGYGFSLSSQEWYPIRGLFLARTDYLCSFVFVDADKEVDFPETPPGRQVRPDVLRRLHLSYARALKII